MDEDDYRCGIFEGKTMSSEDWLKKHEGHEIVDDVEEFELDGGAAVKRMCRHKCVTCGHSHLYKMETVETNLKPEN